jgi:hypothetical protein
MKNLERINLANKSNIQLLEFERFVLGCLTSVQMLKFETMILADMPGHYPNVKI